jgi:hypothetical protein
LRPTNRFAFRFPESPDKYRLKMTTRSRTGPAGVARVLLRLTIAADNAAMETEPSKADSPKRKRRRFQFRLRTLLIGVQVGDEGRQNPLRRLPLVPDTIGAKEKTVDSFPSAAQRLPCGLGSRLSGRRWCRSSSAHERAASKLSHWRPTRM